MLIYIHGLQEINYYLPRDKEILHKLWLPIISTVLLS